MSVIVFKNSKKRHVDKYKCWSTLYLDSYLSPKNKVIKNYILDPVSKEIK